MTESLDLHDTNRIVTRLATLESLGPGDRFTRGRQLIGQALMDLGLDVISVSRCEYGAPAWPSGIVGSLSHSPNWMICVLGRSDQVTRVGVDIEPVRSLDVMERVAPIYLLPQEIDLCRRVSDLKLAIALTLAFSAKEAAIKAFSDPQNQILPFNTFRLTLIEKTILRLQPTVPPTGISMLSNSIVVHWTQFRSHVVTRLLWPQDRS